MRAVWMLLAAAAVVALAPSPASAATFNVNCKTQNLQNRINAVPAGSVLLVKGACGPVTINKRITIDGNPKATISGKGVGRAVTITGTPKVTLVDLLITNGKVVAQQANGAGINHAGGLLILRRTTVSGNLADANNPLGALAQGGGIYSAGGTLRLFDSAVRKNTARAITPTGASAYAGGIYHGGNLLLVNSTVSGNRARADSTSASGALAGGGGVYVTEGTATITSSHLDSNVATATGGGAATYANAYGAGLVVANSNKVAITGSTLSKNQALTSLVGGIATSLGSGFEIGNATRLTFKKTVIAGNLARATSSASATADAYGAGGHISSSTNVSFTSSRITGGRIVATTSGTATGSGAGLSISGTPLTLSRTLVASNTIAATAGSGSATAEGGGLHLETGSNLLLTESTVRENRAGSTAPGVAVGTGAGIASFSSVVRVRTSTLNANVAESGQALGGGLYLNAGGPHSIVNSTLSGNRVVGSTARGGGIDIDTTLAVTAATVARNEAKIGGGMYVEGGTTTLRASLFALNDALSGPNCSQSVNSAGRNFISTTVGCAFSMAGTDKTGLAPKLGQLKANGGPTRTISLLNGSPALNAIPKAECAVTRDQRGVKRPQPKNGRCDIGAFERKT